MAEKSIKMNKIMQNKANLRQSQIFITSVNIMDYSEKTKLDTWSKRTQTNPILPAVALAKAGYGVKDSIESGCRFRYIYPLMSKKVIKPRLIAFEVTRRCRYSCRHCRANAGVNGKEELTTSQCKKIIKTIAKYKKCILIFTGGEPMERADIYEIIRYARKINLRPVLATCGYLINEKTITKLKKAGVTVLSFSIDGANAETHDRFRGTAGAFESTIAAAKFARKGHVRFQINTTISKVNAGEVIGIAELAKQLGAYCFNPFILVPTGRGREIADEILDPIEYEMLLNELLRIKLSAEIKVRVTCGPQFARVCRQAETKGLTEDVPGCMGGRGFGFVSYRGDVQICGFLDVPAGNLIENNFNFKKIWEESEFLKEIRSVSDYKGACGICEYVGICGGCRARAYVMSGDYMGEDPVCNYQK
jgi:radical SAM protein with 4Fe4S-binding SPASM domain